MKNQMHNFLVKTIFSVLFLLLIFCGANSAVKAQTDANQTPLPQEKPRNLLDFLNLTPEQIQQIRAIQRQNRPAMQEAQKNQREAQIALQDAIYADVPDQNLVEQRVKEFTQAQRRVVETRTRIEFQVRQVLNADQLSKFKDLRQRFEQMRQQQQEKPLRNQVPNRPLQNRLQNRVNPANPANQDLPNQPNRLKRNRTN